MSKTLLIAGYGPGISAAVAEKFGSEGFQIALVARDGDKLAAAVKALGAKKIRAAAFPADLADLAAVAALIPRVREALGPITAIEWTAYANGAGDLLAAGATASTWARRWCWVASRGRPGTRGRRPSTRAPSPPSSGSCTARVAW